MASSRSSVREQSISSFFPKGKTKLASSLGIGHRKPPDKKTKNTSSDNPKDKRAVSQPPPLETEKDILETPGASASQPPPTSAFIPFDITDNYKQANEEDEDTEEDQDSNIETEWNWLIEKNILQETEHVSTDDMISSLIKLATINSLTKDTIKQGITYIAHILRATVDIERQAPGVKQTEEEEEGEISPKDKDNNLADANRLLEDLKNTLQDTLIRATNALEEATKELKENKEKIPPPPPSTNPPSPPSSHTHPPSSQSSNQSYLDAAKKNSTLNFGAEERATERARAKAKQLVLDLNGEHKLLKLSNISIRDELRQALKKAHAPPTVDIFMVRKLNNGGLLLELNSNETGDWLRNPTNSKTFRKHAGIEVDFTPRTFNVIAKFMPTGMFNPEDEEHLKELREENCWDKHMLIRARWAKAIERRKPGQAHAHLILTFADGQETNALLMGRGFISYHAMRINIEKDRRIPMRCAKCQIYGHLAKDCSRDPVCGRCGTIGHDSRTCNSNVLKCANCNEDGHEAYSTSCPTFQRKLKEYNERTPENTLPYYPQPLPNILAQQTTQQHDITPPIPL